MCPEINSARVTAWYRLTTPLSLMIIASLLLNALLLDNCQNWSSNQWTSKWCCLPAMMTKTSHMTDNPGPRSSLRSCHSIAIGQLPVLTMRSMKDTPVWPQQVVYQLVRGWGVEKERSWQSTYYRVLVTWSGFSLDPHNRHPIACP